MLLVGEHSKRSYRLGDTVSIRVCRVDTEKNQIDYELVP